MASRDEGRFPEKRAYFDFGPASTEAVPFPKEARVSRAMGKTAQWTTRSFSSIRRSEFVDSGSRVSLDLERARSETPACADASWIADLARHPKRRFIAAWWMPTNSGLVQDVRAIGEVCAQRWIPFLLAARDRLPLRVGRSTRPPVRPHRSRDRAAVRLVRRADEQRA